MNEKCVIIIFVAIKTISNTKQFRISYILQQQKMYKYSLGIFKCSHIKKLIYF